MDKTDGLNNDNVTDLKDVKDEDIAMELDESQLEEATGGINFAKVPPQTAYCPRCRSLMRLQKYDALLRRACYYCPTHGYITVRY